MNCNKHLFLFKITAMITLLLVLGANSCLAQRDRGSVDAKNLLRERKMKMLANGIKPWIGVEVKDTPKDSVIKGVIADSIDAGSPAEKSGLQLKDIITNLDGNPVSTAEEFVKMVSELQINTNYAMIVFREGKILSLTITPVSKPSISLSETADPPAPRKGPLDINTLKYVIIDPSTHAVTFIGKYDPAYATGPLPYADILKDVLDNSYPSFSLEPNDQAEQQKFAMLDNQIKSDIARMDDYSFCTQWAQKLMNLIINDPSLQADNKRFFRNFAEGTGLTSEELKRMYDSTQGKITITPSELFTTLSKLMRGIGSPKAADAFLAMAKGGAPEDIFRSLADAFGYTSQFQALESKGLSSDQFRTEAILLCMPELCRRLEAPENELQSKVAQVRSGQESADALVSYMSENMGSFITNKAGMKMVNGLFLGPELLAKFYDLPVPQSELVFSNVAPDSLLGDILFKADFRLKSMCAFPDVRDKVPGHLTSLEFIQKEANAINYDLPGGSGANVGHTLIPSDVDMRVSPNGDVIEFQDAKVRVTGWVRSTPNIRDNNAKNFITNEAPKYGDYLTQHYDEYAKVYPEWHKMTEVAKLVALARWAKKNNYTINVTDATNAKKTQPKSVNGFCSAVFQINGDKASLTVVVEGGASFGQDQGDDWIKPQPDVTVTSSVLKQLAASTVFAEQAAGAALSGNLDAARDLADKSARAMSGEIDLTKLPSLGSIPEPSAAAAYASATSEVINQASDCLKTIDNAQHDLAKAQQLAATSPEEAAKLTQQATQAQDDAQAKLKQILSGVASYKTDPSQAGAVVIALHNNTGVVSPISGNTASNNTTVTANQTASKPEDWSTKCSKWLTELDEVNKQIASTRNVLLKLNTSIQSDKKLFDEWENDANAGFDRCVTTAGNVAIDFGAGALAERYETIYDLAKKLPGKPDDVIEKYRLMASLAKRFQEAKATGDLDDLAKRENKTDGELFESFRDGIGQIAGLLGLDKTLPVAAWKYGSLSFDMAYNLTELRQLWKNTNTLEANNVRYAEAIKKLASMMQKLVDREKELRKKIAAGEPVDYSTSLE